MTRFHTKDQLAARLIACLEAAVQSPDLGQIEAVHEIIKHDHYRGLDGLYNTIRHDPVDWVMVAAPGFSNALKRATGYDRNAWVAVLP